MANKVFVDIVFRKDKKSSLIKETEKEAGKSGVKAGRKFGKNFNKKVKSQVTGVNSALKSIGTNVIGIAAGFMAFRLVTSVLKDTFNAMRGFSKELANVNSILPRNEKLTKNSIATFQSFAASFGSNSQAQARAFYSIVSAGVKGTANQLETLKVANQAAVAGLVDIDTASRALVSSVNAYSKAGLTATQASDSLFIAVREGQTTFGELADFLGNVSAISSSAGVSFDELTGTVAALTKGGIETSKATIALRSVLTSLIKPTDDAKSTAKSLGIEFGVSAIKAKGLVGFLKDVGEKTGGSTKALGKLFGNVRGLSGVLKLVNGDFEDFSRIVKEVENKSGATALAVTEIEKSLDFNINKTTSAFKALALSMFGVSEAWSTEAFKNLANGINFVAFSIKDMSNSLTQADLANRISDLDKRIVTMSKHKLADTFLASAITRMKEEVVSLTGKLDDLNIKASKVSLSPDIIKSKARLVELNKELELTKAGLAPAMLKLNIIGDIADEEAKLLKLQQLMKGTFKTAAQLSEITRLKEASLIASSNADAIVEADSFGLKTIAGLVKTQNKRLKVIKQALFAERSLTASNDKLSSDEKNAKNIASEEKYQERKSQILAKSGKAQLSLEKALREQAQDAKITADKNLGFQTIAGLQALEAQKLTIISDAMLAEKALIEANKETSDEEKNELKLASEREFQERRIQIIAASFAKQKALTDALNVTTVTAATGMLDAWKSMDVGFDTTADTMKKTAIGTANIVKNGLARGISGGIQSVVKSLMDGENAFANFGDFVMKTFGALAIQLGEFWIAQGIAVTAGKAVKGVDAIIAGAALVAVGSIMQGMGGGGGGAASSSSVPDSSFTADSISADIEEPEIEEKKTSIALNVEGNIFNNDETKASILDFLNEQINESGGTINNASFA